MPIRWQKFMPSWSARESSKHEEAWERLSAPAISTAIITKNTKSICMSSSIAFWKKRMRWGSPSTTCWIDFRAGARRSLTKMYTSTSLTQPRSNVPATEMPRVNVVSAVVLLTPLLIGALATWLTFSPIGVIVGLILGLLLSQAPKVARQWERAVVLRLGRYVGLRGPGLFWIIPFVDTISAWVDHANRRIS